MKSNEWERATEVWARFQEAWPGSKMGVWDDPVEGPVWVRRTNKVVEITHPSPTYWLGRFHIRDAAPQQQSMELA